MINVKQHYHNIVLCARAFHNEIAVVVHKSPSLELGGFFKPVCKAFNLSDSFIKMNQLNKLLIFFANSKDSIEQS